MEQIWVKKEPEDLVNDSDGDILMNYDKPSTSADREMPSTSGVAIKQEIKEELDFHDEFLGKGSEESYNKYFDDGDDREDFSCNIKKEEWGSDFYEEDDKNSSHNEEKDEDEAMFETKSMVEYHGDEYYDESGTNNEVLNEIVLPKEEKESHKEQKLLECDICLRKYQTKEGLYQHKKYVHEIEEQEQFKCEKCEYQSSRKCHLNDHLKIHDKTNYLKCQFCKYMAARLRTLNAHILSKHKIESNEGEHKVKITSKIHTCPKCSYSTVFKTSYDNHVKVCLKLKNVKCYECEICHFRTIHKRSLNSHKKTHNKIKQLTCLFCPHKSNEKRNLDNHILTKHPDLLNESNKNVITSKIHACQHCNYKTAIVSDLKRHLSHNH
ncbi:unnamed protein product [Brassicogethes aeneus]|uniref:C2H2-type domain-containing protein n=1 Tax=Brassicogethes aeneus TaxID=1431903 RepID=A0A9P0AXZ7_BRAAE|nr:unnamed protein product [Brassicogethes aeneus]